MPRRWRAVIESHHPSVQPQSHASRKTDILRDDADRRLTVSPWRTLCAHGAVVFIRTVRAGREALPRLCLPCMEVLPPGVHARQLSVKPPVPRSHLYRVGAAVFLRLVAEGRGGVRPLWLQGRAVCRDAVTLSDFPVRLPEEVLTLTNRLCFRDLQIGQLQYARYCS